MSSDFDDFSEDGAGAGFWDDGFIVWVLGVELYLVVFEVECFDGGLVFDLCDYDVSVLCGGLCADDDDVAGEDACAGHAFSLDF